MVMRVERDRIRAQEPRLILFRAGREAHVLEANPAVRSQMHDIGRAARGTLTQFEFRGSKVRACVLRVIAADARDVYQGIGVLDPALCFERAVLRVVVRMVCAQVAIPLQDPHIALQLRIATYAKDGLIARDVDGCVRIDASRGGARACVCGARQSGRRRRADQLLIGAGECDHAKRQTRYPKGPVPTRQ